MVSTRSSKLQRPLFHRVPGQSRFLNRDLTKTQRIPRRRRPANSAHPRRPSLQHPHGQSAPSTTPTAAIVFPPLTRAPSSVTPAPPAPELPPKQRKTKTGGSSRIESSCSYLAPSSSRSHHRAGTA